MKKGKVRPNYGSSNLTAGKIYELEPHDNPKWCWVIDDNGIRDWFGYIRFEEVKTEKPKTFAILGKPKQLEAIADDLIELGYKHDSGTWRDYSKGILCVNENKSSNISAYKQLITIKELQNHDITFRLPEDYFKVLEHAKKALSPENWEEQEEVIKIGQYPAQFIGNTVTFGCKTDITLEEAQALRTVFTLSDRLGNITFESEDNLYIDGNEIEISILDKVIQKLKE